MYDGCQTHGLVHSLRMQDVFWGRQRIVFKVLDVLLAALPPPASQTRSDLMSKSWRELVDAMYPGNKEARVERDAYMSALLKRQDKIHIAGLDDD